MLPNFDLGVRIPEIGWYGFIVPWIQFLLWEHAILKVSREGTEARSSVKSEFCLWASRQGDTAVLAFWDSKKSLILLECKNTHTCSVVTSWQEVPEALS